MVAARRIATPVSKAFFSERAAMFFLRGRKLESLEVFLRTLKLSAPCDESAWFVGMLGNVECLMIDNIVGIRVHRTVRARKLHSSKVRAQLVLKLRWNIPI
jgi:hypothetical protein